MNSLKKLFFLFGGLFLWGGVDPTFAASLSADAVERVIAADREVGKLHSERLMTINAAFNDLASDYQDLTINITVAPESELESYWRLSGFMAYSTSEFQYVRNMMRAEEEYGRRNILAPAELRERLLDGLIEFRKFDTAQAYAVKAKLPIEYIPRVEGESPQPGVLAVLRVNAESKTLTREKLFLDGDVKIFVVSFIGCTFSRQAADAIEKHEGLARLMRERSTWIVLPGALHFNDVLEWNKQHPSTQFSYIDDMKAWSFVDDWSTPTFYFVKQGKVVAKVKGWPDDAVGISSLLQAARHATLSS